MSTMTEAEFNMATRAPRNTEIPACFTAPADLAKAIKDRNKTYDAWVDAEDAATGAWLAVDAAKRSDHKALVDAVAAGQDDPGTETTAKAERALVVALERVRQAKAKAETADAEVARLYKAHMPEFVPQAVANARAGMSRYREKYDAAKALVAEAERELLGAYVGLTAIREYMAPVMLFSAPSGVPSMRWNDAEVFGLIGHVNDTCDRIEQYATAGASKLAKRSAA